VFAIPANRLRKRAIIETLTDQSRISGNPNDWERRRSPVS
jgi:hypothetical protein